MNLASTIPHSLKTGLQSPFRASIRHSTFQVRHSSAALSPQTPSHPIPAPPPCPTRPAPLKSNLLAARLSEGENVQIGKFVFNRKGITTKTILRGELRAGWNEDFEVRPKSKENLLLKYLSASARLMFDHWEIFYHNQAMGKMVNMGEFSFDDDNGCMIPFLISFFKESQTDPWL